VLSDWLSHAPKNIDQASQQRAEARQQQLTKPAGSLGQLEQLAIRLAGMQGRETIAVNNIHISVFAADHGIALEGVSAYPQVVTTEMIRNFARGGAAISVMARALKAHLEVVDVGSVQPAGKLDGVIEQRIAAGTRSFLRDEAMTIEQLNEALTVGRTAVQRALDNEVDLFIGGDMGIANTSSATAIACALTGYSAGDMTGPGTGLDTDGVTHKAEIIEQALNLHGVKRDEPMRALQCFGGFEIAALTGAYLFCGQQGLPVLVDGFIASAAALVAVRFQPQLSPWLLFAHRSAEPGHRHIIEALQASPLLDLQMRLGEGSGAAVAVPLLQMAVATHNQMATFAEAGVSEKQAD
jgi:nicotinate-nucleotide--dimethylbenzimidazole phosphoribosyltransferase